MTQPLGQGASSWARTTRFAELEWGMSRKKVQSMFGDARVYPRREGRNPHTGEVMIRESLSLPSKPPPVPALAVHGSVRFDDADRLDSITLTSTSPRPDDVTNAIVLLAVNKVLAALGVEELPELPDEPATWKHKATHIELSFDDDCFWFELTPVA